jgi:hypothetical protein
MVPDDCGLTCVEIEDRAGGPYRTWKSKVGVLVGGFDSELLELVPDKRPIRSGVPLVECAGSHQSALMPTSAPIKTSFGAESTAAEVVEGIDLHVLLATSPRLDGIGGRYFEDCNEGRSSSDVATAFGASRRTHSTPTMRIVCGSSRCA